MTSHYAQFMMNARKLYEEMKSCPELYEECKGIVDFFEVKVSAKELVDLLGRDTFKKPFSLNSNRGHVVRVHKLVHKVKDELKELATDIGKIDMYVSLAKLMKEHETQPVKFCFATYTAEQTPLLDIHEMWHPLIDSKLAISNNVLLGGTERQNMIITGPNAGGKSTILRSLALCIILGQTIGIVPASAMHFTPFHTIKTSLHVVDDISAGNSLFMAEACQAQRLIERVEQQGSGEFSFACFDEIFNGTAPIEGSAAAYSFAHHLAPFKNNICIISTHFSLLTKLEEATDTFKNYRVSVKATDQGEYVYPFKLEAGVSHQCIALEVLKQQGFPGVILDKAAHLVRQLHEREHAQAA